MSAVKNFTHQSWCEECPADVTTQNAPARSCSSGEGKDRTNNLQEAGTAMTSMTESPATTKDGTCPTWCSRHLIDDDGSPVCRGSVTCGDFTVDIEDSPAWVGDPNHGGPIVPPDYIELTPAGARDLAAALVAAARLYEEGK